MELTVSVNLPPEVEQELGPERSRLSVVAREAVAIDLFRRGLLNHAQLGITLGLNRFEIDALLKCRQVTEHLLTHQEVDAELESINELVGRPRS